ncbi:MAG TPA: DNA repair protein RecN [Gammaproteobacteria bacterium]|nr:DNA repair protein RecN [Gammaproteobacteria bacterium]
MLRNLNIHNFTLVKELDIEISNGMSVVTGETGAGKSIMLDALSLTLGSRADASMISIDADRAEIIATFDVSGNESARQWISERELQNEDTCILRRVLTRDGRSRGFINGSPSTLADMSQIGNLLADIHSQHEHQSLLSHETHKRLLDEYGAHKDLVSETNRLYVEFQTKESRLQQLIRASGEESSRLQLLEYQLEELQGINVTTGEVEGLEAEQKRLSNAEDTRFRCNQALELCRDNDTNNVGAMLAHAIDHLSAIDDENITGVIELLRSSQIQIEEAVNDLQSTIDKFIVDPERLNEVETRLSSIYDMARKHHVETDQLPKISEEIAIEIDSLRNADVEITSIQVALEDIREKYLTNARQLSDKRQTAANKLQSTVTEKMKELGMPDADFSVQLKPKAGENLYPGGAEDIEFLVSTNNKQPNRPLARIASGGELSRISLAIQVVTADTSRVPTLVFDEVDVGIGGAIAEVVGSLLKNLGTKTQIICVTHLPQVAVQGHYHFRVIKDEATTQVIELNRDERVSEIARMLGGIQMTDQSLAHAKQMLTSAQE